MPDLSQVGWFLAIVFFLTGGVNQVMKLLDRMKESPNPRDTYLTKEEFAEQQLVQQRRLDEIEARQEASRTQRENDRVALRGEMHDMRGEIRGDIQRIHERLDGLPERVIATLVNTGAIGKN